MTKLIRHKRSWLYLSKEKRYNYYEYDDCTIKIVFDDGYQVIKADKGHCVIVTFPDGSQFINSTKHEDKNSRLLKHKRNWRHKYDYYEYDDATRKTVFDDGYQVIHTSGGHYITKILPDGRQHTNFWNNEYWFPISCWRKEE